MKDKRTKSQSWKDLKNVDDSKKKRPISGRARWKFVGKIFNKFLIFLFIFVIAGVLYFAYNSGFVGDILSPKTDRVKFFDYSTNGCISKDWAYKYIDYPKSESLSKIDIFFIKKILEDIGQIRYAEVKKVYPNTLKVEILEHEPMARISTKINSQIETFIMSTEGKFFKPVCIPDDQINTLPYIGGIKMVFANGLPMDYPMASRVKEFLNAANEKYQKIAASWNIIDLSELSRLTVPVITVTTKDNLKIIFAAKDYEKQLERLDYILKYEKENPQHTFLQIDLSLKNRADVKVK